MASITSEMLYDMEKETVDTIANFDATRQEPVYLPAKLPNLLLMGAEGIAVGMATKIPPHNLTEVIDAVVAMITKTKVLKNNAGVTREEGIPTARTEQSERALAGGKREAGPRGIELSSDITLEELLEYVKGPDFPTKGAIYDINEIKNLYTTGKGRIIIRGKAEIEEIEPAPGS
jgi:DNA gyrase subunit A